jgi:hypothetical protein
MAGSILMQYKKIGFSLSKYPALSVSVAIQHFDSLLFLYIERPTYPVFTITFLTACKAADKHVKHLVCALGLSLPSKSPTHSK